MTTPAKPLTPQELRLVDELRRRGESGITPLEALDVGCGFRLSARIQNLRLNGYRIATRKARTVHGAVVARYVLMGTPPAFRPTTGTQTGFVL